MTDSFLKHFCIGVLEIVKDILIKVLNSIHKMRKTFHQEIIKSIILYICTKPHVNLIQLHNKKNCILASSAIELCFAGDQCNLDKRRNLLFECCVHIYFQIRKMCVHDDDQWICFKEEYSCEDVHFVPSLRPAGLNCQMVFSTQQLQKTRYGCCFSCKGYQDRLFGEVPRS